MDDPNFPQWAQWTVLAFIGAVVLVVAAVVIKAVVYLVEFIGWMNSGSH